MTAPAPRLPVPATGTARPGAPPEVVVLGRLLLADPEPLVERLVAAILSEDPAYSSGARTSREDLARSCRDNVARVLQALVGDVVLPAPGRPASVPDPFDAPRATGRRRAEQGMPLESVLHAYRVGFRIIWEGLVSLAREREDAVADVLLDAATEVWEIVDAFSSAVADAYRRQEAALVRRDDRRREALLDALLEGRGNERAVAADAAAALDLPEHGRYAVVVLDGAERAGAVRQALAATGARSAWRVRADREVGLVALGPLNPADVAAAVTAALPDARAGVSCVVDGLAAVDGAARQAETALRALPPDRCGADELEARLPGALLVSSPDLAARLVERALGGALGLEPDERDVLLDTLRTWLETGGSASATAARLYCHRNTVLNRLRRLEALTGRSLDRVDHLVEWSLALLARDVLDPAHRG